MVHISDIEKLPKSILCNGELYQISLYVTAFDKLAVCYKKAFPMKQANEIIHIFTQVVEPNCRKIPIFSNDVNEIVDVRSLRQGFLVLKKRVEQALECGGGFIKIYKN
jgi:hypothetical protein